MIKYGKLHLAQFQLHTSRATSAFVSVNEDAKPLSITASQVRSRDWKNCKYNLFSVLLGASPQ